MDILYIECRHSKKIVSVFCDKTVITASNESVGLLSSVRNLPLQLSVTDGIRTSYCSYARPAQSGPIR